MTYSSIESYDYGIVGGGIAGMQLALAMLEDSHFSKSKILIIEKEEKKINDKTLCFWEQGIGKWDKLVTHRWKKGKFINSKGLVNSLHLGDYEYKMLPSLNFYHFALSKLQADDRVTWIKSSVSSIIQEKDHVILRTNSETHQVKHCFDSRITIDYNSLGSQSPMVYQPFVGLEVEFDQPVFDTQSFTMMDYQYRKEKNTAFFYVLPTSTTSAMIEYTLFIPDNPSDMEAYVPHIDSYIKTQISPLPYRVNHREEGMIPMSTHPFHNQNTQYITKIGTAGSWVRPSTGYAFKYIEYYVNRVIKNIKTGNRPSHQLFHRRHRMMDELLLDLLQHENEIGPWLFDTMYRKVDTPLIFKFLDGNTSLIEDLKIMNSFKWAPFFRAIRRRWF